MIDNYIGIIPTFRAAIYSIRAEWENALAERNRYAENVHGMMGYT